MHSKDNDSDYKQGFFTSYLWVSILTFHNRSLEIFFHSQVSPHLLWYPEHIFCTDSFPLGGESGQYSRYHHSNVQQTSAFYCSDSPIQPHIFQGEVSYFPQPATPVPLSSRHAPCYADNLVSSELQHPDMHESSRHRFTSCWPAAASR